MLLISAIYQAFGCTFLLLYNIFLNFGPNNI